jgi:hypothetical protein
MGSRLLTFVRDQCIAGVTRLFADWKSLTADDRSEFKPSFGSIDSANPVVWQGGGMPGVCDKNMGIVDRG